LKLTDLTADAHTMLLHRAQMCAPRDQRDVFTGTREHRTKKSSDSSCANDCESHDYCLEFRLQAAVY